MPRLRNEQANKINVLIGNNVRTLRKTHGLSSADLASVLDISYQQLQKYETGANRLSADYLYLIAKELGVKVSVFYEKLDEIDESNDTYKHLTGDKSMALFSAYNKIEDQELRDQILKLTKHLGKN